MNSQPLEVLEQDQTTYTRLSHPEYCYHNLEIQTQQNQRLRAASQPNIHQISEDEKKFCRASMPFMIVFVGFFTFVVIFLISAFWINSQNSDNGGILRNVGLNGHNLEHNYRNFG